MHTGDKTPKNNRKPLSFIFPLLLIALLSSCHKAVELPGFDAQSWENDRQGCKGIRKENLESFKEVKELLIGHSEMEVAKTLGKPDIIDLGQRHTKKGLYFVEPSPRCGNVENERMSPLMVKIEYNSMGNAVQVIIGR